MFYYTHNIALQIIKFNILFFLLLVIFIFIRICYNLQKKKSVFYRTLATLEQNQSRSKARANQSNKRKMRTGTRARVSANIYVCMRENGKRKR